MSLPTRERGLKCVACGAGSIPAAVAPYAGAWIEIGMIRSIDSLPDVAPYAGAWIEIENMLKPS